MKPIVMAGGSGSRLWPKSRAAFPKQFLSLTSEHSMLQDTLLRLKGLDTEAPVFVCNDDHRFIVAEQLRQAGLKHDGILLEPMGKNTAPAIALAALHARLKGEDPILLVLAADHVIQNTPAFHQAVKEAEALARQDKLVTFGVVPTCAHTGYGYIKRGAALGDSGYQVASFEEKPDMPKAQAFVDSGEYLWNSGMFMFKASRYLQELSKFAPEILGVCEKAIETESLDLEFVRVDADIFATCPEDSIDYAVMEKTDAAAVVPLDAGWSDVGSWSSLWEVQDKDENGNVVQGDAMLVDVKDSYINAEQRLIAVLGLQDVIVVETKDAILVAHKDKVQDIKTVVNKLKAEARSEYKFHREVFRPWGSYDSIDNGQRFQVKRITVKPGEKLSVQMHHHRAEHWIVVSGTAKVTCDEDTFLMSENQSTYIPIGVVHSLENPGKIPLELIEVQSGAYLGEDDIVRFSDRYGRTGGDKQETKQ
ncbi:mannose-1-phosphate guanylyltransferase/mannose-6-phosphate isomerase [Aliiglaciecola sp. CAU 1673]|uniref:mannose-1-phosphate guanylyltransferase/mannose-6-phosphate isomerase n=1 Tax=Aliiglaciecola sp. CAU 1673 TaxID=3032595 RepID=UPI0023DB8ED6|nr:mannose-1-phosphate guanylyltransferase/mannose-6-phosphate isomerase [Aliiglaciecola sp. CAU 1673]MDF2179647.1 mannose-1-phosphate guanylyltransferase/mannose-6-phosphate isomerase [Aliiglaciecola sp. CAU 1673]